MRFTGLLICAITFFVIGVFHPVVIKAEYYFSKKIWPLFAVVGVCFVLLSLRIDSTLLNSVCAVFGGTCLWSVKELFEQEKRVGRGWFPKNPRRRK
ncbi:MAG: DUF4491 family protein [Bacillota bacterium]|jgi:uncharacterized membrane protein YoaK (UPF0700 family)